MNITAIKGFNDILAEECEVFRFIEEETERVFTSYGFSEIRTPIAEKTELFLRTIGETTDIIEKQMYTFTDRHGESVSLRPEGTASAVRAYIEHKLFANPITRLFYKGAMFRYERPQKGRYRQFHQIGAETLGEKSPKVDAEALEMLKTLFSNLGVHGVNIEINSLGCGGCRSAYKTALGEFLGDKRASLCDNCKGRIEKNPLRALDCKNPQCLEQTLDAPSIVSFLCDDCKNHFEGFKAQLKLLKVEHRENPRMVRGLDYYTKTTFEVTIAAGLGSQNAIAAGGRYDNLVKELGGAATPCFGFAIGVERLALLMDRRNIPVKPLIMFIPMDRECEEKGMELITSLREKGLRVVIDYGEGTLKNRMKRADKIGAGFVIILGEDELKEGMLTVKDMKKGVQEKVKAEKAVEFLTAEALR